MAEIYVTSTADSGAGSLRQAIDNAQDGDVILFDSDVFPLGQTTSILLSAQLVISKSISIYGGFNDGAGGYTSGATKHYYVYRDIDNVKTKVYIDDDNPALDGETVLFENVCRVALDGQETIRPFVCQSTDEKHINIYGLGINNGATSSSADGAGIFSNLNAVVTIADCSFLACKAGRSGGGVYAGNSRQNTLNDCAFDGCSATSGGGVFSNTSSQNTLNNCVVTNCSAASGGGVYSASSSQNTLNDCTISNCSATNGGGGLRSADTSKNTLNDCIFDSCSATNGGGVCSTSTSQNTLTDCVFDGCSATNGGGVYSTSTSQNTLTDCVFDGCSAASGGGVYSTSTSQNTLTDCVFDGCSATNGGGVYSASTSQNTLNDCNITGCSATSNGGGVYSTNSCHNTLTGCRIARCSAHNGGGVHLTGSANVIFTNCTFKDNTATGQGFAVYATSTSISSFVACSFINNDFNSSSTPQITSDATAFDSLILANGATFNIVNGITTAAGGHFNAATININDGAALTITTSASIGAATFTSEGRGYLAVASGINTSAATLTGVVLCAYGAGLETFSARETTHTEIKLDWTQTDTTIPVLVEHQVNGVWETVVESSTGTYNVTVEPATRHLFRAFDGVSFHVDAAWHGIEAPQFKVVGIIVEADAQDVNWQAITEVVNVDGAVRSGQSITILARIYDAYDNETVLLNETGNIVSVIYTLEKRSKSLFDYTWTPVEGHDEVEVSSECVLEDLQTSDAWTIDEDGYSFVLTPDTTEHTLFATPGVYRFRVKITLATGNPVVFYEEINVVDE